MCFGIVTGPYYVCSYQDYRICKHLYKGQAIYKDENGNVIAQEGCSKEDYDGKYADLPEPYEIEFPEPHEIEKELPHRKTIKMTKYYRCAAYPDGIPQEIINKKIKHFKPYKQDNDIVYEPGDEYEITEYTWNKPKYTRYNFRVPQSILDKEAKEKAEKEAKHNRQGIGNSKEADGVNSQRNI